MIRQFLEYRELYNTKDEVPIKRITLILENLE